MTESRVVATTVSILRPRINEARRDGFPEAEIIADVAEYLESLASGLVDGLVPANARKARKRAAKRLNSRVMAELFPGRN